MSRWIRAVFLVAMLFVTNCHHECETGNLLSVAQPAKIEMFEVRDARGTPIWRIESQVPRRLRVLKFREIPDGFVQSVPASGRPRQFVPGEHLKTFTVAEDHTLEHDGYAVDATSFCGGVWRSTPRREPARENR